MSSKVVTMRIEEEQYNEFDYVALQKGLAPSTYLKVLANESVTKYKKDNNMTMLPLTKRMVEKRKKARKQNGARK